MSVCVEQEVALLLGSAFNDADIANSMDVDACLAQRALQEQNARFREALIMTSMAENRTAIARAERRGPRPLGGSPLKKHFMAPIEVPPCAPTPLPAMPSEKSFPMRSRVPSPESNMRAAHYTPVTYERIPPLIFEPLRVGSPERPGLTPLRPPPKAAVPHRMLSAMRPLTTASLTSVSNISSCLRPPKTRARRPSREISYVVTNAVVCGSSPRGSRPRVRRPPWERAVPEPCYAL